jgi:hypothetical protein
MQARYLWCRYGVPPAIAARLHLGSWNSLSAKLHHWRKRGRWKHKARRTEVLFALGDELGELLRQLLRVAAREEVPGAKRARLGQPVTLGIGVSLAGSCWLARAGWESLPVSFWAIVPATA